MRSHFRKRRRGQRFPVRASHPSDHILKDMSANIVFPRYLERKNGDYRQREFKSFSNPFGGGGGHFELWDLGFRMFSSWGIYVWEEGDFARSDSLNENFEN